MAHQFIQLEKTFKAFQNSRSSHEQDRLFIDIVNHIQPKLFIKFKSYGIQNEDIEDLVQETLIRIYLALHTFDFSTDVPFEHYLNCIVRSMRNDFWRRKYIETDKHDSIINDYVIDYKLNQSSKYIEDICMIKEKRELLASSLKVLSRFERNVAELLMSDYTPSEIAKQLGIKDKVVYNSIQRCKMKMKYYLLKRLY